MSPKKEEQLNTSSSHFIPVPVFVESVFIRVCDGAFSLCDCIYSSSILCEHLPQSCNYTALTNSRWLRSDTFGGAPHDGGDQREIYITAAHIHKHKKKTSLCLSVEHKHMHTHKLMCTHTDIYQEMYCKLPRFVWLLCLSRLSAPPL